MYIQFISLCISFIKEIKAWCQLRITKAPFFNINEIKTNKYKYELAHTCIDDVVIEFITKGLINLFKKRANKYMAKRL